MSTKEQIDKIEQIAYQVWKKYTPFQLQEKLLSQWENIAEKHGLSKDFEPLYPVTAEDEKIKCGILGSGGFSTGRMELEKASALENKLGWAPIEYSVVISNRNKSNAKSVADEFSVPALLFDYSEWRKENNVTGSTKLFGFAPDEQPGREILEDRIRIKKSFDSALHNAITEKLGEIPLSISLRGYDFILTDELFTNETEVDNTHPATLIIREDNGEPAYAGWQESAYNKMREDGITSFTTSLIRVDFIGNYDDLIEVDAGELLAISPGAPNDYNKIEDHFLLTLKATGLLPYFWGLSKETVPVEYLTKSNKIININQRKVIVGDKIMSGKEVFGQSEIDLEIFSRFIEG
jgi:folate-dependent phosphoribosylglycinamide formyltransferase PurN